MRYVFAVVPTYPTVHVPVAPEQAELVADSLFELGATGVEERDATTLDGPDSSVPPGRIVLVAHFADEPAAVAALETLPMGARLQTIAGDDWRLGWRDYFEPSRVGKRLVIRPPWRDVELRSGDVVVVIDPGQAFGTGTHETTRLVLAELEENLRGGETVLDVGCGSGILAVSALLLGASEATCVDVDREALRATRETAARNGVSARVHVTLDPIERLTSGPFDVVLANIESSVLVPMANALAAAVAPGGWLVLSGLLDEQVDEVSGAYRDQSGLAGPRCTRDNGWAALRFGRSR